MEFLDLSQNSLRHIPTRWISQMPMLRFIYLGYNQLTNIPYSMFHDVSTIEDFDVSSNRLTTFEFWLIAMKNSIRYLYNPVTHFSNNYNVDLSKYQFPITRSISLHNPGGKIQFDDSLFEMYNRCQETDSIADRILMEAIRVIHNTTSDLLNWTCSCAQYHFQKYLLSNSVNLACVQTCPQQSTFDTSNIRPRFCKIQKSEPGEVPQYIDCDLCDTVGDE